MSTLISSSEAVEQAIRAYKLNAESHRRPVRNPADAGMHEVIRARRIDGNPTHYVSCNKCFKEHAVFSNNHDDLVGAVANFRAKHMQCGDWRNERTPIKTPGCEPYYREEQVWKTAIRVSSLPVRGVNRSGDSTTRT